MNQLRTQEFKLSEMIEDAELALSDIRSEKRELISKAASLKSELSKIAVDIHNNAAKVDQCLKPLKMAISEAQQVNAKLEGHHKWKNAIREVFGQEGLDKCVAFLESQKCES